MVAIQALTGVEPSQLPEDDDGEIVWSDRTQVNEQLADFLTKMTRYHFRERYQTAGEALKALKPIVQFLPTQPNRRRTYSLSGF